MKKVILATTSPYRREKFGVLGIPFEAEGSNVDEKVPERPQSPEELVQYLAQQKAEAVAKRHTEGVIIGFDSVGLFEGEILEKPESREEARSRLLRLSGNTHQFYTGICMIDAATGKHEVRTVCTDVHIRQLSEREIDAYLDEDSRFNTYALGYDPVGHLSCTFAASINGSYHNLLCGIPLEVLVVMLNEFGVTVPQ